VFLLLLIIILLVLSFFPWHMNLSKVMNEERR
jgi:hypothetical protein